MPGGRPLTAAELAKLQKQKRATARAQQRGGGAVATTNPPADKPGGPGPSAPAAAAPASGYDWGDGRGRHSISLALHNKHVADKNPLYDPTTQLSGSSLQKAAGDLVGLEFDPQEAAIKRELDQATTQGGALAQRAADYSAQVAGNDAQLFGQLGAAGTNAQTQLGANSTATQQAIQKMIADSGTRQAADAKFGVATTNQPAEAEAMAQAARAATDSQSSRDAAAVGTQAYQALGALSGMSRVKGGQETQDELLNRVATQQADLRGQLGDVASGRGKAMTDKVLQLRQQGYENLVTQKGLDIKTADLQAQTAQGQAKIAEQAKTRRQRARDNAAARKSRAAADQAAATGKANETNEFGYTNRQWQGMTPQKRQDIALDFAKRKTQATTRPGSSKTGDAAMPASALSMRTRIDSMVSDIGSDPKLKRHQYETGPRLTQILVKRGASPLEAQAAAEIARYGVLKPTTLAALKRAKINVPQSWIGTAPTGRDAQPG